MRSGLCHTRLNALDFFHDDDLGNLGRSLRNCVLDSEHFLNFCGACVGAAENEKNCVLDSEHFSNFCGVVWELPRMKTILLHRKNFSNGIEN